MATVLVEPHDREFEELYRRYEPDVHRYALAVSQNGVDAEDVTQQTFMNAYRALLRGERPRAPLNWLIAIAHNVFRERLRRASRRPTEVALDENLGVTASDESRWSADDIRRALSHLCPKQRAVIVLRELEGRPYSEIAKSLGLSLAATEALAFRARRALREQLEAELTCQEAQAAVLRRLDGGLSASQHAGLRAHLRACPTCAGAARSRRGRARRRLGGLALIPFPLPLKSLFGGGSASAGAATAGGGVAVKAAAVAAAGMVATGVGYETVRHVSTHPARGAATTAVTHEAVLGRAIHKTAAPVHPAAVGHQMSSARAKAVSVRPHAAAPGRPAGERHATAPTPPATGAAHAPVTTPERAVPTAVPTRGQRSHARSKPSAGKHQTAPRLKPAKHVHVRTVHHRGRSADSPSHAGNSHAKGGGSGAAVAHGKANGGGKGHAGPSTNAEALPPPPPDEATADESDG